MENNAREDLMVIVAGLWCLPQHSNKEMDVEFAMSIVDLIKFDRKATVEKIVCPLKECNARTSGEVVHLKARNDMQIAMNKALEIAEEVTCER